jgi:nucleoside phosphorylase
MRLFNPEVVFFVGTAGGIKSVKIGDVVVADEVYSYESGVTEIGSFLPWPDVFRPTYHLLERARIDAVEGDWLMRLKSPVPDPKPDVFISAIASGEKLVASNRSDVYQLLASDNSDVAAVEMEGAGFLRAAYANPGVEALLVRGISDLLNDAEDEENRSQNNKIAAEHASAFAFEVLANLKPDRQPESL